MLILLVQETCFMVIVPCLKIPLRWPKVYLFVSLIIRITIYFYFIHYTFLLTFAFQGISNLIPTVTFSNHLIFLLYICICIYIYMCVCVWCIYIYIYIYTLGEAVCISLCVNTLKKGLNPSLLSHLLRWSVYISYSFKISFSRTDSRLRIYHLFVLSNLNFCTVLSASPCPPSRVWSYTLFSLIYCFALLCDWSFRLCHHKVYIWYFASLPLFSSPSRQYFYIMYFELPL